MDGRNPSCGGMGGERGGMGGMGGALYMPAGGALIRGMWVMPAGGTAVGGALVGGTLVCVALVSIVCGTLYPPLSGVYLQA